MIYRCLFILAFCIASIEFASVKGAATCKLDLGFVLDRSSSIPTHTFDTVMLNFVKDVAKEYGVSPNGMHAGMVIFSQNVKMKSTTSLQFMFCSNQSSFDDKVTNIKTKYATDTRIDLGLKVANEELFHVNGGMRNDSKKFIILITDGEQRPNNAKYITALMAEANKIWNRGIDIVAIGVGNKIKDKQLKDIVNNGQNGKYLKVTNFAKLKDQLPFLKHLCKEHCSDKIVKADIAFLVDLSNNLAKKRVIVNEIARRYKIVRNVNHRAALISFSDSANTNSGFMTTAQNFLTAVKNLVESATISPRVDLAMKEALEELFGSTYGGLAATKKVLFVLFDGSTNNNVDMDNIKTYAEVLRNKGVIIIAIVLGNGGPLVQELTPDPNDIVTVGTGDHALLGGEKAGIKSCLKQPKPCNMDCKLVPKYVSSNCQNLQCSAKTG